VSEPLLKFSSFAKINPRLQVLGKRDDGYHQIDTILQTISLHDDLMFVRREDGDVLLHCDAVGIPTDHTNLVLRAAAALKSCSQRTLGADIFLTKRIPAKAGLGGASSNAAVTLLALNSLWQLVLSTARLKEIGSQIGSDVPFFFYGGTARAEGTGTEVSALPDWPKKHLILITPNVGVSTAQAYGALRAPSLTTHGSVSILSSSFAEPPSADSDQWALNNDFEEVIFEIEPEIERAKQALLDAGAQDGLLAGSGSSVFGIFEDEDARERASVDLKIENGWLVFPCETISREEYFERLSLFPVITLS
jgi:4-diphosphocytidyl-2-C-methyl-D-erythritol kinase